MTVGSEVRETILTADGVVREWPFSWRWFRADHIEIAWRATVDDDWLVLDPAVWDMEAGVGEPDEGYLGGTIIWPIEPADPLVAGGELRIQRVVPYLQEGVNLDNHTGFNPQDIERELDLGVMRDQQNRDGVNEEVLRGVLRLPPGFDRTYPYLPTPTNGKALVWHNGRLINSDFVFEASSMIRGADLIETTFIDPAVTEFYTAGYSSEYFSIGGPIFWRYSPVEPSHSSKHYSLDGRWWELWENEVAATMFGARYDALPSENRTALNAMFEYMVYRSPSIDSDKGNHFKGVIDDDYVIDGTVEILNPGFGLILEFNGSLTAHETFPLNEYMIHAQAQNVFFLRPNLDGGKRAAGIYSTGRGNIFQDPRIYHYQHRGISIEGTSGNQLIRNPAINQWNYGDDEYQEDAQITATGVYINTEDCRIEGGIINYNLINIHIGPDSNTCDIQGCHPFNGRGAGEFGPNPRIDAKNFVIEGACSIYDCYLDGGQIDIYGSCRIRNCWLLIFAGLFSEFTGDYIIGVFADGTASPNRVMIDKLWTSSASSFNLDWRIVAFLDHEGNSWSGDYTIAHAANYLYDTFNVGRTDFVVDTTPGTNPTVSYIKPRGDCFLEFNPGAWAGAAPRLQAVESDGGMTIRSTRLTLSNPAGEGEIYFGAAAPYIKALSNSLLVGNAGGYWEFVAGNGNLRPGTDNMQALGGAANRASTIYAGTGTINTSDGAEKTLRGDGMLTVPERAVARRLAILGRMFKWNASILTKGEAARTHIGVTAQQVEEAFAAEGLDGFAYGVLCRDAVMEGEDLTWRYGIRYDQLAMWREEGLIDMLTSLEARVTALESE